MAGPTRSRRAVRQRFTETYCALLQSQGDAYARGGAEADAAISAFDRDWPSFEKALTNCAAAMAEDGDGAMAGALSSARLGFAAPRLVGDRVPAAEAARWFAQAGRGATHAGDVHGVAVHAGHLSGALLELGRVDQARTIADRAIKLAETHQDEDAMAVLLGALANLDITEGMPERARECLHHAARIYEQLPDPWGSASVQVNLAELSMRLGPLSAAEAHAMMAETVFRRLEYARGISRCRFIAGTVAMDRGDLDGAEAAFDEALGWARKSRSATEEAEALGGLARIARRQGRLDDAEKYCLRQGDLSREQGDANAGWVVLGTLSHLAADKGDLENALELARHQYAAAESAGNVWGMGDALGNQAQYLVWLERGGDAEDVCRQAIELSKKALDGEGVCNDWRILGQILQAKGDCAGAEATFLEAARRAESHELPDLEAAAIGCLGLMRMHLQEFTDAISCFRRALELHHRSGAGEDEVKDLINLAICHELAGERKEATDAARRAHEIASEFGLPDAADAEELLESLQGP